MTPPMTPREKVAKEIVEAAIMRHHPSACVSDTLDDADAILTALASGSGDHAELARLADRASSYTYDGWRYVRSPDPLSSGRIMGSENGPVLAVVQWPVPTMDHALSGHDGSEPVGAFIAAANPATVLALLAENAALRAACSKSNDEISQTLGKALGYPWFKDDQINFPGATAENGVCVGDHVAESLADEAARRLTEAERKLAEAEETSTRWAIRFAELRKAAGIGVKPMLSDVPGELRKMRERLAEAVLILTGIAKGEVPPEQHGHYLAHRQAVKAARTFLSKEAERG